MGLCNGVLLSIHGMAKEVFPLSKYFLLLIFYDKYLLNFHYLSNEITEKEKNRKRPRQQHKVYRECGECGGKCGDVGI